MKIIKTAQFEALAPDPGLGHGATEVDISDAAGTGMEIDSHDEQGHLNANVDWDALMESHLGLGYWDTNIMAEIEGVVPVELYYTFNYKFDNFTGNVPSNIEITQIIVFYGNKKIVISKDSGDDMDIDLLYRFKEDFEDVIIKDIENNLK